jgi:hypothetical protein
MTAKRRKLQRLPHVHITPEVAWAFQQIRKLETQCSCQPVDPKCYWRTTECPACEEWWEQQTTIHRALRLPPHFWPALPEPNPKLESSSGARALYEELEHALGA